MKKDRIYTTSIREIKSSFKRFLSLFVMSMLGVGVFVGLKSSAPNMMKSLDVYYDKNNVYDIKIVSTLGISNSDIVNLSKIKGIKKVYGIYSKDVIIKTNKKESVAKIIGINNDINKVKIIEGRKPINNNEIVVEKALLKHEKLKIGDSIKVLDDETFKENNLKIVGVVKSSLYISSTSSVPNRGNTNLGSGKINYYAYVNNSNFNIDYFTEMYATLDGAKKEETNSNEYNNIVSTVFNTIDKKKNVLKQNRYNEIYKKYEDELQKNKKEAENKLSLAKNKLDDTLKQLSSGKKSLDNSKVMLDNAKNELDNNKNKLDMAKNNLINAKSELDSNKKRLDEATNTINEKLINYGLNINDINNLREFLKNNNIKEDELINSYADIKSELDVIKDYIPNFAKETLINFIASDYFKDVINSDIFLYEVKDVVNNDELISIIKDNLNNHTILESIMDSLNISDYSKKVIIDAVSNEALLKTLKIIVNDDNKISTIRKIVNDDEKVEKLRNIVLDGLTKESIDKLSNLDGEEIKELFNILDELRVGNDKYNEGLILYNNSLKSYEDGNLLYQNYYNEYQNNLSIYNNGLLKYNSGLNLYNKGLTEYYNGLDEFNNQIKDATLRLNSIEKPKWYIYDRMDFNEYSSYIDDGNSVSNLSKLFPTIFFIVAVLISLISMSRMVEDDRMLIGTLKSLGYNNKHIRKKYILYSGLATLLGSLTGSIIGFFALSYYIWNIYKILFDVPIFRYKYDITNVLVGTLIAIICICGTTLIAIKKVVKEKPSELLRPKAPTSGKRILLEKITFIWNRINFSNKITIRNIVRYKKRVFMTMLGIVGCTALMLTGFGIRDSIVDIPSKQYNDIFCFDDMAYLTGNYTNDELDNIFSNKHITNRLNTKMIVSDQKGEYGINIFVPEDENKMDKLIILKNKKTGKRVRIVNDKIVISDKLAELKNKKIGDKLKINDASGNSHVFEISGIVENYVGHYVFMNKHTYEKYIEEYQTNIVYYTIDNIKYDSIISKQILNNDGVMSIMSVKSTMDTVNNMLKSLNSVVLVLIVLSGALSFAVLYNLSYINISERKREIATLKVLGFTDKEVDNYIIKEMSLLTIFGIIFGLILGIFLTNIMIDTVEIEMVRFMHKINALSFILTAIFIAIFTVIVNIIIHFHLKKIDMIESLKSVE